MEGLDDFLLDLDVDPSSAKDPTIDPKAARLQATFDKAKSEYVAKVHHDGWFLPSSANPGKPDLSRFEVSEPSELAEQRKSGKKGAYEQEWTINYLYVGGHFRLCLAYVVSFCYSMNVPIPLNLEVHSPLDAVPTDGSRQSKGDDKRPTRAEKKQLSNWHLTKETMDACLRCVSSLVRQEGQTEGVPFGADVKVQAWIPADYPADASKPSKDGKYQLANVSVRQVALGLIPFLAREIRLGAGDPRVGYSGMAYLSDGEWHTNPELIKAQNWTVSPGLALTLGDACMELGLYRGAIEAHSLFLAARGQHWRTLLALSQALTTYADQLPYGASRKTTGALQVVAKAAVVLTIQNVPRRRRMEVASLILEGKVVPKSFLADTTPPASSFADEDAVLFALLAAEVLAPEACVGLVKIVCAKKGDVLQLADKYVSYLDEYRARLCGDSGGSSEEEEEEEEEEEAGEGPRSVRTL